MDANGIGQGLAKVFATIVAVIVFVSVSITALISWSLTDDFVESKKPIKPEIKLIIEDNKVDTLYIYREP